MLLPSLYGLHADGLLPSPISFTHFGTSELKYCAWFVKAGAKGFAYIDHGKQICVKTPAGLL
jgi:hypothetical protein